MEKHKMFQTIGELITSPLFEELFDSVATATGAETVAATAETGAEANRSCCSNSSNSCFKTLCIEISNSPSFTFNLLSSLLSKL